MIILQKGLRATILLIIFAVCLSSNAHAEVYGPKIKGFQLGMSYNEGKSTILNIAENNNLEVKEPFFGMLCAVPVNSEAIGMFWGVPADSWYMLAAKVSLIYSDNLQPDKLRSFNINNEIFGVRFEKDNKNYLDFVKSFCNAYGLDFANFEKVDSAYRYDAGEAGYKININTRQIEVSLSNTIEEKLRKSKERGAQFD